MESVKMKVNPLPVRTWHWTRMNDSELKIACPADPPGFDLKGQTGELTWIPDADPASWPAEAGKDPESWAQIETGMGGDFAGWMQKSRTVFLGIPSGYQRNEAAILTVDAAEGSASGQILLHAGAGCEAGVILKIRGNEKNCCAADTAALQLLVQAEEGAHLKLFVVQLLPRQEQSCVNIGGVLQKQASVELVQLSLGARNSYLGIALDLAGDKSVFSGDLGYRIRPERSLDINYVSRQEGRDTNSVLHAWGVLEDGARKLFRGTIDFKEGCAGSVGTEQEEVLLLGERQVNKTIPLILCHEEDVEGNHGATISRLDEQMLFYLRSRGVQREAAENMIAKARLEALAGRIPDPETRREAESRIGAEEGAQES